MNKHKKLAYCTAFCLGTASILGWTGIVRSAVTQSENIQIPAAASVIDLPKPADTALPVAVQKDEPKAEQEAVPIPSSESQGIHSAAVELKQWEIQRAWTISIDDLGVRAPILLPSRVYWNERNWDMLEEQMQVGLFHGTVAYPHSSAPGLEGTLFVAGHSSPPDETVKESLYGSIFASLPDIAIGATIVVQRGDKRFEYVVTSKDVVSPQQTSILAPGDGEEAVLKLITCFPVGTTQSRMIVTAHLLP